MKQIDIIKTINEILFFNNRSNCYFESANQKDSHGNAKIYKRKSGLIQQHLKKNNTAKLSEDVKNAILNGMRFFLYPDLQTVDPVKKNTSSKNNIEPYEFANRCVAVLMTLFDYNLVMLKIKKDDDQIKKKITRIYNIIDKLLFLFVGKDEIEDDVINQVFLAIISSSENDIDDKSALIFSFNQIWNFHEYTAKLFSYFYSFTDPLAFTKTDNIELEIGTQIESDAENSYSKVYKLTKILKDIEKINLDHEREDLINEGYITSDNMVNSAYDVVQIRMKESDKNFIFGNEIDTIDFLVAKIVYNYRYKKTKKSDNNSQNEYNMLVSSYNILKNKQQIIPPRIQLVYTQYIEKLKFSIDYLKFYSAILHQFSLNQFNHDAYFNPNKEYVSKLTDDEKERLKVKIDEINRLNDMLKDHIPFNPDIRSE